MKLAFVLSVILLSLLLTPSVHATPVTVSLSPNSQVVPQGSIASVAVGLSAASIHGAYRLSLSGLYSGLFTFSPSTVATPTGSGSSTLRLDASSPPLYCPGIYPYTVTATNSTAPPDSGSASGTLTVVQVGPSLSVAVTTDKSTYKIGDTVTIQLTVSRPANVRLTISGPSGSPTVVPITLVGTLSTARTMPVNTIGRYTVTLEADDFCSGFSSSVVYFDVTPNTYDVSMSLDGVPSTASTPLTVDGQSQGTIGGTEIKTLTFRLDTTHTIMVAQYVSGNAGVRYFSAQNSWTVGSTGSHTFSYSTEYMLTLATNPDGVAQVTGGGWMKAGSSVQTSQAPDTLTGPSETKYVFKGWTVDGVLQTGNPVSITMDKPHKVVATYETQYKLQVESQYGDAKGAGYYANGSIAAFSVTTPVGFLIQQVFVKWDGDFTGTSPSGLITMDKPHTIHANWTTSYFQLYILVGLVAAVVVIVALLLTRRRQTMEPAETKPIPPTTGEGGQPPPEPGGEAVKCTSCGADVAAGQAYCQNCGLKIG